MVFKSGSPAAAQILEEVGVTSLPADWNIVRVEELLSNDRGISVGVMYPGDHDPVGVPLIRAADVAGNRVNERVSFQITPEKHHEYRRTALTGGELLISLVGDIGRCAIVAPEMSGWNAARAIAVLRFARPADAAFVRFCLMSPPLRHLMRAWATTTVQETLNLKEIRQLPIPWPPDEQRATIVSSLGALDDKIELKRHMNETLEAMARAIFKDWFVDFGPTRAKIEGRAPYLAPKIWALFPNLLDNDGKPQGWQFRSIYEVADVIYGAPFASVQFNTEDVGEPLLRIRDLANESPGVWTPEMHPKGYKVRAGDIVVGMDGEFRAYLWGGAEAWLNQRVCVFNPKQGYSPAFVRNSIMDPLAQVEATETATTVIHLGKSDIDRFLVTSPTEPVIAAFNEVCQPFYDRIVANKQEIRTLTATRDLLLPKLISGEIRVRDTEKIAEAAQ